MRRCIVKSCANRTDNCCKTEVSFFNLPKNEIMRECWLRKIGEVMLPSNIKNAKICSDHFTKESFHIGRRQKSGKCINPRRFLLPNAFPTIMSPPTKNKTVSMDFKVIHREFLLPTNIHKSTDEKNRNNVKAANTFQSFQTDSSLVNTLHPENATPDPLSIVETVVNVEASKSPVQKKPRLDKKRIFETPQHISDALHSENATLDPLSVSETVVYIEAPKSHVRKTPRLDKKKIFETSQHTSNALHPENATSDPLSVSETVVYIEAPKSHVQKTPRLDKKKIFETPQHTSNALHPENATSDPLSVSETVVYIEAPKSHVQKTPRLDKKKIFETPQNTSNALHPENATSDPLSVSETVVYIEAPKSHVQKKPRLDKKRIFETPQYTSDVFDNVYNNAFPRRFIMENCSYINETTHKSRQNEEAYNQSMKLLKTELEHHQPLNEFHLQSRCNKLDEIKDIEKECQTLRLQLAQKNEDIQKLVEEKNQMKVIINDLQVKLVAADLNKHNVEQTIKDKITQILKRYFTEGQIRCMLENRKWVRWSIDDYASAISFRSVSPEAYKYLQLKLNFPLPSLGSLRRNKKDFKEI
ncbi:uncharacterized protein LOC105203522 isoform X4 [Solenopsis invicta]|uniref:uncharacterized protein LOC105203522 isoform X4 n=1 Tax=Solenopsis invicta TaxID=13686 RepID=UPI00193D636E|nr:uncharacterized protein LOC105203522 isoform X4 [Solenopsis invicta]